MDSPEILSHQLLGRRLFLTGSTAFAATLLLQPNRVLAHGLDATTVGDIGTVVGGGALRNGSPATQVAIGSPFGLSIDSSNNLYICDNYYHRIYKVAHATGIFTTIAGSGVPGYSGDGGRATAASLNFPYGVAADQNANLSIADANNNRVRWVNSRTGKITTAAGTGVPGYNGENIQSATAEVNSPHGVGFDSNGNLYIADSNNNRIRVVNTGTEPLVIYPDSSAPITVKPGQIATVAGTGKGGFAGDGGLATACKLNLPWGVSFGPSGAMYVADYYNQRVRVVDPSSGVIQTIAGTGSQGDTGDGGPSTAASLSFPSSIALDASGNIYIGQEQTSTVRKIDGSTGVISTVAGLGGNGEGGDGGPARTAMLSSPTGVAVDSSGNLYIAEYNNGRVRIVDSSTQTIETFTGCNAIGNGGAATAALLSQPCGFSFGPRQQLVLSDEANHEVRVIAQGDTIMAVAGTGFAGYNGDGIPATSAQLDLPCDAQYDQDGNVFICDRSNERIRRVDHTTGLISTVAGNGQIGYGGDGGPATDALLNQPRAIAIDADGNLYIAELNNLRVRFVNLGAAAVTLYQGSPNAITVQPGVIITAVGTGVDGSSGDGGPAVDATLNEPRGVTTDPRGNLYVTEGGRDNQNLPGSNILPDSLIRKVDSRTGNISTICGTTTPGYNGDGIPATQALLNCPRNVCVDSSFNVYISDSLNNRVRFIDASTGLIQTIVGGPQVGFSGDGGPAGDASICTPRYVGLDAAGNLYLTDDGNSRIRRIGITGYLPAR